MFPQPSLIQLAKSHSRHFSHTLLASLTAKIELEKCEEEKCQEGKC